MDPLITTPDLFKALTREQSAGLLANRYLLGARLGEGSMGTVHAAFDTQARRVVAVKLLRALHEEDAFRFKQSFRAALSLRHPHLLEVYDCALTGETPYLTMELVAGEAPPIGAPYGEGEAVDLAGQLLLALDYLHARGLLHRDLKPENLRVGAGGVLKLLDLGTLAPIGTAHADHVTGTLAYLAPEVFQGRPLAATADLYAVGVLLYELLAGELPFTAASAHALIDAHLNAPPPDLAARRPDLSPALTHLVDRLLAKSPAERPQRASEVLRELLPLLSPAIAEQAGQQGYSYLLHTGLVGRREELATLDSALQRARAGAGGGVLLGSHPGVGRSRLLQEFRLHCQLERVTCLGVACTREGMGPYAVLREVLRALSPLAAPAQQQRMERLLGQFSPGRGRTAAMPKAELHQALSAVIAEVARRAPLAITVDDLQWADTLSLEVLLQCLEDHARAPVLWLGAYRLEAIDQRHAVSQALDEHLARGLVLGPLDEAECRELVCGALGVLEPPAGLLTLVREGAAGNCAFVLEMLRYLVEQGRLRYETGAWRLASPEGDGDVPESLDSLVCARLQGMSEAARQLARLGAVLVEPMCPAALRELSELPEQALLDALNELLERRVWAHQGRSLGFVHERTREALYAEIPLAERRAWHGRLAESLEAAGAPSAMLAFHRAHGPEPLSALPYLRRAGSEAERLGAMQEAFGHWQLAAELLERHAPDDARLLDIWLDIGVKCGFSVDSHAGEAALDKALARLETFGHPYAAARLLALAIAAVRRLPAVFARPILERLARPRPFSAPRWRWLPPNYLALLPLLIEANTWLAICCNVNGRIAKAYAVNRKAQALVPDRRSWAWGVVLTAFADSHMLEGRFEASVALAREAFALLREERRPQAAGIACAALVLANHQVYQGAPIDDAVTAELAGRSAAQRLTEWQGMAHHAAMVHHLLAGRGAEAARAIAAAQPFSRRCGRGTVLEREIRLAQAHLHALRGEFAQALEVIEAALALDAVVALPHCTSRLIALRGRVHLERGAWTAAQRDFEDVVARESAGGLKFCLPDALLGLAEVARQQGALALARDHAAAARAILDAPECACSIKRIWLLRQEGRLASSERRWQAAVEQLGAALALARAQHNPYQCALALGELGQARRAAGDRAGAQACFEEALSLYEALDNAYGAAQMRRLLAHDAAPEEILTRFAAAIAAAHTEAAVYAQLLDHARAALPTERLAVLQSTAAGWLAVAGAHVVQDGPALCPAFVQSALDGRSLQMAPRPDGWHLALPLDATSVLYAAWAGAPPGERQELCWLLRALGAVAGVALQHARGLAEERQRAERLKIFNEMSQVLASARDTEQILDHLLLQVLKLTGVEQALVVVRHGRHHEALGVRTADDTPAPPSFSRSIVERVIAENTPLCVLDAENSAALATQSVVALGLKSVMAVPLPLDEQFPSVLYVSSRLAARTFNAMDLELLRAVAAWAAIAYRHARQARWLERHASANELALAIQQAEQTHLIEERQAIAQELSLARTIQQGFFPTPPRLSSLDVHGACQAAREVGGDFYDVIPLGEERVAIAIGDVSGKGVSAALYMAVVRTAIRMALPTVGSPRACLIEVNHRLRDDLHDGSFVTCFLGIYDERTRRLSYASAGHQLAYLIGDGVEPLKGPGVPLGLEPEVFAATIVDQERVLAPGDRIALVTDGVLEALDPEAEEFGEERLFSALCADAPAAEQAVNALIARIREHVAGAPAWDDMTVLVAQVATAGAAEAPCSA